MIGLFILLVSAWLPNAPARLYERGDYEAALEAYRQQAAEEETNWPLQYNLGATAYRAGAFAEAAQAFERALGTRDQALQARALYNLGNSRFRIAETLEPQGPQQALPTYQQALKHYEQALALTPEDADAAFNRDLVKQKIEELQQTQQQEQEQEQEKAEQNEKEQENEQEQEQDKEKEPDQDSGKSQEQSTEEQPKPEPTPEQAQADNSASQPKQPDDAEQRPAAEPRDYQQIQAQGLLDRLREQERIWNFYPELEKQLNSGDKPAKDW